MGKTTRELVGEFIDLENDLELAQMEEGDDSVALQQNLQSDLEVVRNKMKNKVDNIDKFSLELSRQENLIDAEMKSLRNEMDRLNKRKKAINKTKDFFNKSLIPMIIQTCGNDGVFRTNTSRYSMYETWEPIEVIDEEAIPDKYRRYKMEVDKKGARKDVIEAAENGIGIGGFAINKVKRVRRS